MAESTKAASLHEALTTQLQSVHGAEIDVAQIRTKADRLLMQQGSAARIANLIEDAQVATDEVKRRLGAAHTTAARLVAMAAAQACQDIIGDRAIAKGTEGLTQVVAGLRVVETEKVVAFPHKSPVPPSAPEPPAAA